MSKWGEEHMMAAWWAKMRARDRIIDPLAQAQFDRERIRTARNAKPRVRRSILDDEAVRKIRRERDGK